MVKIYFDYAASTPQAERVSGAVRQAEKIFGNPSSFNNAGREARKVLESARQDVAKFINARASEIVFTSSGSESNNLAILGSARLLKRGEIVSTPIEHPSVLEALRRVPEGIKAVTVPVFESGSVDLVELEKNLTPKTILVSIIYANNEIGIIQPINKIKKIIQSKQKEFGTRILFHLDACQATGYCGMNVQNLGVDLMAFNSSKVYGPRGVAALFVRTGLVLGSIIYGGEQERGLRAGTENLAGIVGFAEALRNINPKEGERLRKLGDYFFKKLPLVLPQVRINGGLDNRLPNNINISILGLTSERLLLELDKYGISAGSGSACTARSVEPSHVLKAIGVAKEYLDGALRFSLGRQTTKKEIDYLLKVLPKVIENLRKIG